MTAEIPAFLDDLNRLAELSGLQMDSVQPNPEAAEKLYMKVPVALAIRGRYHELAKFFYKQIKRTHVRVIELDPRIVIAAREHFILPADNARLKVEVGDGVDALAPECCDLLIVDAFEDELHVPRLASAEFYDGAFLALREPGAMVINFMNDDPKFDQTLARLERAFGRAVLCMPALYDPNIAVFAFKGVPSKVDWSALRVRAAELEGRLGLPFTRYVSRLRAMNPSTPAELIIAP